MAYGRRLAPKPYIKKCTLCTKRPAIPERADGLCRVCAEPHDLAKAQAEQARKNAG